MGLSAILRHCSLAVSCVVFTTCVSPAAAQPSAWQVEVPFSIPARESAVVQQLANRLDGLAIPLQLRLADARTEPPLKVLEKTQAGEAQLTLVPVSLLASRLPEFSAFDSLFVFQGLDAVDRYTNSTEGQGLLEGLRSSGLRGLGFVHGGMVQVLGQKALDPSRDFKGLKIAPTLSSESVRGQFSALGASASQMAAAELDMAVQMGAVDAREGDWSDVARAARNGLGLSVLESNHRYRGYVLVANEAAFQRLGVDAQQRLLSEARGVVARHNGAARLEEKAARAAAVGQSGSVRAMTQADYDVVLQQLKAGAWGSGGQATIGTAVATSDPLLARKHFGNVSAPGPAFPASGTPASTGAGTGGAAVASAKPGLLAALGNFVGGLFGSTPPMATTASASSPAKQVVYNADFSPQLPRESYASQLPVLGAGQPTTLRFGISSKWTSSVLGDAQPSPELLNAREQIALSIVMSCSFCAASADSVTARQTTYRPQEMRSDEINLKFTPQRRADGQSYRDKLQLSIVNEGTGREYDRLVIPVLVSGDTQHLAVGGPDKVVVLPALAGQDWKSWRADLIVFAHEEAGRTVSFAFQPVSDRLKTELGPLALHADGRRIVFRSGVDSEEMVNAMTNSAFGVMSAVSMQGDLLKKLSASGIDAAVSKASQESLELTEDESGKVSAAIAESGRRLYYHLFTNSADTGLRKLVAKLEELGDAAPAASPLRLVVVTNRLSLPWQYLHPHGKIAAEKFWGMKFSLSVVRVNSNARQRTVAADASQARKVVFARYGSSADPTIPFAKKQAELLRGMPLTQEELLDTDNGPQLIEHLQNRRKEISGIVTFLHASAGSGSDEPELKFNTGDVVPSRVLERLLFDAGDEDVRYLSAAPLVILNACETGPSRHLPHVKLQDVMFSLGAQGVLVTEVSVWVSLGHEVATRLLARLSKGEPVGDALTAVRSELRRDKNNPLGLLYVYYGDPAATLRR